MGWVGRSVLRYRDRAGALQSFAVPTVFDVKLAEAKRGAAMLQVENAELRRSLAAWQDFFLLAHRRAEAFEVENGRLRQEVVHLEHERHMLLDIADALRDILKLKRRKP